MDKIYPDIDLRKWEVSDTMILADADNYYTKKQVDDKIEEIITSGITEEECQEMIDASITSKADTSAVTAIDEAYKAADSVISGAVDNVSSGLTTEAQRAQNAEVALDNKVDAFGQYVDANFAEKDELEAATGNLSTQIQAIQTELDNDYATEEWVSGYTYDKTATDVLLNEKLDVTAYTPTDLSNYYQKSETSGATEIQTALNDKANTATTYTKSDVDGLVSDLEAADSVISGAVDNVSSGLTTEVQRAQNAESVLSGRVDTLSGAVQTISGESVTSGEVQTQIDAAVSGKADTSAVTEVASNIATVSGQIQAIQTELDNDYATEEWVSGYTYDKQTIEDMIEEGGGFIPENYYTKTEINGLVSDLEATDTSISGAVDNVSSGLTTEAQRAQNAESVLSGRVDTLSGAVQTISGESVTSGEVQTMIDEAVSGKADTATTYTKTETDNAITAATADMATQSFVRGYTYDKQTIEDMIEEGGGFIPENYYDKTATDALLNEKLDVTAYTPTDLSNYYQKSETSGSSQISAALNAKADTATTYSKTEVDAALSGKASQSDLSTLSGTVTAHTANTDVHVTAQDKSNWNAVTAKTDNTAFTAHTANTTAHVTAAEKSTWNNKSDFTGDYNDLTNKPTIPTYTAGDGITISNNVISAKIWQGTKAQYEALTTKDSTTIYLIYEE